jgi:hypothetical protein
LGSPDVINKPVNRDGLVGVQQQTRHQRPQSPTAERHPTALLDNFERAEDPEVHATLLAPSCPNGAARTVRERLVAAATLQVEAEAEKQPMDDVAATR